MFFVKNPCCCGDGGDGEEPLEHCLHSLVCDENQSQLPNQIAFSPEVLMGPPRPLENYHYAESEVIATKIPFSPDDPCHGVYEWRINYLDNDDGSFRGFAAGMYSTAGVSFERRDCVLLGTWICAFWLAAFGLPSWDRDYIFVDGEGNPVDDVKGTCLSCGCSPALPDLLTLPEPLGVSVAFPGQSGFDFDLCLPIVNCQTSSTDYEVDLPGCPESIISVSVKCVEDGEVHQWMMIVENLLTGDEQALPIAFDDPEESFSGSVEGSLTIFCETPIAITASLDTGTCPMCVPVFTERGALKLFGTLGGATFEVCLFGPRGASYTGPWKGGILQFEGGPCDEANLLFEIYCKDLGGGVSEWTLKIVNSDSNESVEVPVEWFDPLFAQGDVSGPVDLCGETGLAFAAAIAMFTGADPSHPFMRCCFPDLVAQCDLPKQLMADATPVPSQFDPCTTTNCHGVLKTMDLHDTPLECGGNLISLPGYSSGDSYFIGDFPATTHPIAGADAFNGHKLLFWCDGTGGIPVRRWARLDENGCVHLNETGEFTTWDCESFSGTIEYNFDGSQDCCDGFGLSQWVIQVARNL